MTPLLQIREFVARLPDPLFPYHGKTRIQVRKATAVSPSESGWLPISALAGQFFQPAFAKRNPLNIPGPFYGGRDGHLRDGDGGSAPQCPPGRFRAGIRIHAAHERE